MSTDIKAVLRYPGAKWQQAGWIIKHFPPHQTYIEPFFGSGAIFFSKRPSEYEVINDKSGTVVNLFRVIRSRGDELAKHVYMTPHSREEYELSYELCGDNFEDARRFLVRCWQAHGITPAIKTGWKNRGSASNSSVVAMWNQVPERILAVVERLKGVEIENRSALNVIERYAQDPDALFYLDPPYVASTRNNRKIYLEEMDMSDQVVLLSAINKVEGAVVLSGYPCETYDRYLKGWNRVYLEVKAEHSQDRTEVLWLNEKAAYRQETLF